MRYVRSKIEQDFEEHAYRIYISDGMYGLIDGYKGRYVQMIDIEARRRMAEQEKKTGEDIAAEVIERAGLTIGEKK